MKKTRHGTQKGVIRKIIRDIGKERKRMAFLLVIIAVAKIALAFAPHVAGKITDYLTQMMESGKVNDSWFYGSCILLAILYFIGYTIDIFVNKGMVHCSETLIRKLRNDAQKKLNRMSLAFLDNHPAGDLLSRMTNDCVTLSNGFESTLPSLLGQMVLLISLILLMLFTNWMLTLVYLIIFPIGFYFMTKVTKKTSKLFKKQNEIVGDINALISDTYSNHILMKAYSCEKEKKKSFDELNASFNKNYIRSRFLSGIVFPISILISNGTYISLCILGGFLLIHNSMTIGDFLSFIIYGNMISTPLSSLGNSLNNIQNSLGAASRIYDFLEEEEEREDDEKSQSVLSETLKGEVEFKNVRFGYTPERILMKDVSFYAAPGSFSAIVGPSGAGKTTLINLLMRFYEIQEGHIFLDHTDTRGLSKNNLRKGFGMVLQDAWIFSGTIADNIRYGKPNASLEEIREAAKKAQCDDFIMRLSDGYDTLISEEKSGLSSGEKQLIALARTILVNPQILILDEATSQVDTRTEYRIVKAMEELTKGKTTFMIAHRLFTIKNADQIMYMENGDIKEVGNHEELMRLNGGYARLYNYL